MRPGDPIDGNVLMLAAAKASVPPRRLAPLVDRVRAALPDVERFRRRYEVAYENDETVAFFVDDGFWADVGEDVGLDDREIDAVRRAHHEQLIWTGKRHDRRAEFETALEVRDCVVLANEETENGETERTRRQ
ncbi:MAG: hypothetical protein ABEI96_03430 [Haloarculaceae archaeon]